MCSEMRRADLAGLVVPDVGRLISTGSEAEPYRLLDASGEVIGAATLFFEELHACDRSSATIRSYGHDLLRWWRFLAAVDVGWERASPEEGRDFARWMKIADKPRREHWRRRGEKVSGTTPVGGNAAKSGHWVVNEVTGKPRQGQKFSPATRAHAETVLRAFYDFQMSIGAGPVVNPFPVDRSPRAFRSNAHHDPQDPFRNERKGRYRPKVPKRIPKRIPDDRFNELFAALSSNRDRAMLAFWVSTGARADELLSMSQKSADPGQQLITVIRKGTREVQQLPASPDAFVWLRIYQEEAWGKDAPHGCDHPLWMTLRRPWRQLSYSGARAMFSRAQSMLGSNWTIHDLRHTAAFRMTSDPDMPLSDVQWILGHAHLTTTQLYLTPSRDEVFAHVRAHHARYTGNTQSLHAPPAPGYNPAVLDVLFGGRR